MTELHIEHVDIASLTPDPQNVRKHSEANIEAIMASLEQFGQVKPIVISEAGVVIAGNGTLEAASHIGWDTIAVVRVPANWSADQIKAYAIADNRTGELAHWDKQALSAQLIDLQGVGFELDDLGFTSLPVADLSELTPKEPQTLECPACGHTWREGDRG